MHFTYAFALSLAVASASAKTQTIDANYDDIPANPALPLANPVPTPYDYLAYPGWNVAPKGPEPGSLVPHTLNNAIGSFTLMEMLEGQTPSISIHYPGSNVTKFDLLSTYIGCVVASGAEADLPELCTLQFNGTQIGSGKVVSESCSFAGTSLNPAMTLCTFSSAFRNLDHVNVTIVDSTTTPPLTIPELDDVTYTVTYG